MLRPDPTASSADQPRSGSNSAANGSTANRQPRVGDVDIQQELNKLEELILESPRIPFSGRTLIDEDELLDQLDAIRLNLPTAFRQAVQVLQQRDDILAEAERYAQDLIQAAEQQAGQILDQMGLVQQAEQIARQVQAQAQAECEQIRANVRSEVEQFKRQSQQEWDAQRQSALQEQEMIQQEADAYADRVLFQVEQQLAQMLNIIQSGRSQLQPPPSAAPANKRSKTLKSTSPVDARARARAQDPTNHTP
jgi:cell division septum initiation protein DivIVA